MHTHTHTHSYVRTHTCTHKHSLTYTHAHTHTHTYKHTHTHVHTHTHTHTNTLTHIQTHTCSHAHTHTHTHTHSHACRGMVHRYEILLKQLERAEEVLSAKKDARDALAKEVNVNSTCMCVQKEKNRHYNTVDVSSHVQISCISVVTMKFC